MKLPPPKSQHKRMLRRTLIKKTQQEIDASKPMRMSFADEFLAMTHEQQVEWCERTRVAMGLAPRSTTPKSDLARYGRID